MANTCRPPIWSSQLATTTTTHTLAPLLWHPSRPTPTRWETCRAGVVGHSGCTSSCRGRECTPAVTKLPRLNNAYNLLRAKELAHCDCGRPTAACAPMLLPPRNSADKQQSGKCTSSTPCADSRRSKSSCLAAIRGFLVALRQQAASWNAGKRWSPAWLVGSASGSGSACLAVVSGTARRLLTVRSAKQRCNQPLLESGGGGRAVR
jgi:hypothetical protein